MDFLNKIKSRSEEDRKKVLFVSVGLIMLAIFYVWMSTFKFSFLETGQNSSLNMEDANVQKFSPFEMLYSKISNLPAYLGEGIKNINLEKKEVFERSR